MCGQVEEWWNLLAIELTSLIAAFVISFREGLEASLVVIVVMSYLRATGSRNVNYVYYGISAAAALAVGIAFTVGYAYASYGDYFEAAMGTFAVVVLVSMIVFMKRHSHSISSTLRQKLERGINSYGPSAIFIISFTTVLREGVEAVIFISPFIFLSESGSAIGSAAGLLLVGAVYLVISSATRKMDINSVFRWTSLALIVFASAILAIVVHNLQSVHLLPSTGILMTYTDTGSISSVAHSLLVLLIGFDGPSYTVIQACAYLILLSSLLMYFFSKGPSPAHAARPAKSVEPVPDK